MRENKASGTWDIGDEVTFKVKGTVVNNLGTVQIGCKTFNKGEITDVALGLKVRGPKPSPSGWIAGDAVMKVGGPPAGIRPKETPLRVRQADGSWVCGGSGRLIKPRPMGASTPFPSVDARVDWEVEMDHYKVLVKGGKAVA